MQEMFFGVKRVHLRILHLSRALLRAFKITPARFDMLRVIWGYEHGVPQSTIGYLLGVSAPTVSRMLEALEALGLVTRERLARDRRCLVVHLTEEGSELVREATNELLSGGPAEALALRPFKAETEVAQSQKRLFHEFLGRIRRIRRAYDDPAEFAHPWRVGPFVPVITKRLVNGRITAFVDGLPLQLITTA